MQSIAEKFFFGTLINNCFSTNWKKPPKKSFSEHFEKILRIRLRSSSFSTVFIMKQMTKCFKRNMYLYYSQTVLANHLYKTTTRLRQPTLSPPKQIPIQSFLCKTTACPTQPASAFFCLPNEKKTYLKQSHQNFTLRRNEKQI